MNEALDKKAEKTKVEEIEQRLNQIHELALNAMQTAEKKNADSESEEEDDVLEGVTGENG